MKPTRCSLPRRKTLAYSIYMQFFGPLVMIVLIALLAPCFPQLDGQSLACYPSHALSIILAWRQYFSKRVCHTLWYLSIEYMYIVVKCRTWIDDFWRSLAGWLGERRAYSWQVSCICNYLRQLSAPISPLSMLLQLLWKLSQKKTTPEANHWMWLTCMSWSSLSMYYSLAEVSESARKIVSDAGTAWGYKAYISQIKSVHVDWVFATKRYRSDTFSGGQTDMPVSHNYFMSTQALERFQSSCPIQRTQTGTVPYNISFWRLLDKYR